MRADLDLQLVKDHPILFSDRHGDMRATAMCWGFECGDGWYGLLKEAADKLEPLCRAVYEAEALKEKPWYKHVRAAIARTARVSPVFGLLYKIISLIQPNIYGNGLYWYGGPPCRASQVKEKYGTLRFYMTASTDKMKQIIAKAERKSHSTCEECGAPGKVVGEGWLYCRCRKCFKKLVDRGYTVRKYGRNP